VPGSLYHAAFTVSTTVADPTQVPSIRLRANTLKQYAYVYTLNSHGVSDTMPTSNGAVYDMLFTPAPTAQLGDGIQLSFDLVGFTPDDAANGQIALDEYLVTRADKAAVDAGMTEIGRYDFATDRQGWSFEGLDVFGNTPPTGVYSDAEQALTITSSYNMGNFGFWQSPTSPTISASTVYTVLYTVSTDVADRAMVPMARLRTASENGQYTFHLEIVSDAELNDAGLTLAPQVVPLYLYPHPLLAGDGLKYAFDLANFDFGDSPDGTLLLEQLQVLAGPSSLIP